MELVSGDNWSYKTCKALVKSSPTNQRPTFYMPDALPVAHPTVSRHWRELISTHNYFGITIMPYLRRHQQTPLNHSNQPTCPEALNTLTNVINQWKSAQRRRKHCSLAVVRPNQKLSTHRRPPSRGHGMAKI